MRRRLVLAAFVVAFTAALSSSWAIAPPKLGGAPPASAAGSVGRTCYDGGGHRVNIEVIYNDEYSSGAWRPNVSQVSIDTITTGRQDYQVTIYGRDGVVTWSTGYVNDTDTYAVVYPFDTEHAYTWDPYVKVWGGKGGDGLANCVVTVQLNKG